MKPYCVIFDLDGTLVDSETLCHQAMVDLLPELEQDAATLTRHYRGMKLAHILSDLAETHGLPVPADFEPRYRKRVVELFETRLEPIPGVPDMLARLKQPFCIASSGPLAKIQYALAVTGLASYFGNRLFSAYEINSWKPEPDLFLHAAQIMGYDPDKCVVIEDSKVGVEAAKAAGMRAIQFLPASHQHHHPYATPFDDMYSLPSILQRLT
ncbi:HAD-IA family hydrolase [Chitinivorax sp. B]|uniref:HAD-IA family hydrolase n=1 Tax=Chitinivorax sp. B TaxID=2502235 RepID=UPI0010F7916D|nr:HAD-IA family hydrolase [Chitinivorax sp. B]